VVLPGSPHCANLPRWCHGHSAKDVRYGAGMDRGAAPRRGVVGRLSWAWSRIPAYPVMVAVAAVLATQTDTGSFLPAAFRSIVVIGVGAALLVALIALLTRDLAAGGMVACALVLVLRSGDWTPAATAVILGGLSAAAVVWSARTAKGQWRQRGTAVLNTIGAALLLVGVVGSLQGELSSGAGQLSDQPLPDATVPTDDLPDIYVLMLDGYPRADIMDRVLKSPIHSLTDGLEARGFDVAADSRTNFMYTAPSLISFFDLGLMGAQALAVEGTATRPGDLINRGRAVQLLKDLGYTTHALVARWERESLRGADRFCDPGAMNELELQLVRSSLLGRVLDLTAPGWKAARDRSIVEGQFECAVRTVVESNEEGPDFAFVHLGVPHLPIIFDARGGEAPLAVYLDPLEVSDRTRVQVIRAYTEQLDYVDARALEIIDDLLAGAARPPVIIVLSDHGSWLGIGSDYDASSDLRERFGNLFASSTPGHEGVFPDDVSVGQVLPLLFNTYLGTDVVVPQSRYYFSRSESIFDLAEVKDPFARE
jgi:hypothetical protein